MMDTETDYPEGLSAPEQNWLFAAGGFGDQKAWLEEDLAAASKNRHNTPWIIVGTCGHGGGCMEQYIVRTVSSGCAAVRGVKHRGL